MDQELLKLIKKDRDAYYVNRGFYFQYLKVLQKWVQHYIDGNDVVVYTEVGNDIKEVGEQVKLVYTQIKCYKAPFSFQSNVLKKEIFSFFVQYLEEKETNPDLEFHFFTNTSLTKRESLLASWMDAQPLVESALRRQCCKKIKEILNRELKQLRAGRLNAKRVTEKEKAEIKSGFSILIGKLDNIGILEDFVSSVRWFFGDETPAESIAALHNSVLESLKHEKFDGKPPRILLEALLSEICRCSQLEDRGKRKVDFGMMTAILSQKEEEMQRFINDSLIKLLDVRYYALEEKILHVEQTVELHSDTLAQHSVYLDSLLADVAKPKDRLLPQDITMIAYENNIDAIGRGDDLLKLNSLLIENRCVSLSGVGGIGKSTLARLYANSHRNDYDHMMWIEAETGICESFILNQALLHNLSINPEETPQNKFLNIIQKLNRIEGKGLIVINDLSCDENDTLVQLKSLSRWHIILTSRLRVDSVTSQVIEPLLFEDACKLYRKFEPDRQTDENTFQQFFDLIDYNTLTIVLVAKTIHLSFDLTLESFFKYLHEQRLDDGELEVDIELAGTSVRLLNILQRTFSLNSLNDEERYFMEFFALLPAEEITMTDLVIWNGKESEKNNKIIFTRVVNALHKKGLITRNGNHVKMDKIFQESVLYQMRKDKRPFLSQMFHISHLAARIREGAKGNPQQAVHFVKYAQSYLTKIKEEFRGSIYQQMLLLENETLNILIWLQTANDLIHKWEDLTKRALTYLDANAPQLGVIFHNYAITLTGIGNRKKAAEYFDKSIDILKCGNEHSSYVLNMMCNKAHLYIQSDDIHKFKTAFEEIIEFVSSNNLWYDPHLPLQFHLLGTANKSFGNFSGAKKMFTIAINLHRELPADDRNDLHLTAYFCDFAFCCLMDNEIELAEKAAITAVNILYRLEVGPGKHLNGVIELLICITDMQGESEMRDKLKGYLDNLSQDYI